LNLRGFEGVDARDKRGHDESVIVKVGMILEIRGI